MEMPANALKRALKAISTAMEAALQWIEQEAAGGARAR